MNDLIELMKLEEFELRKDNFSIQKVNIRRDFYRKLRARVDDYNFFRDNIDDSNIRILGYPVEIHKQAKIEFWFETNPESIPMLVHRKVLKVLTS